MSALTQSRHKLVHCQCPLLGGKSGHAFCGANVCTQSGHWLGDHPEGVTVSVDLNQLLFLTIEQNRCLEELIMLDRIIDWLFGTGEIVPQIPADVPHHELLRGFGVLLLILLVLFLVSSIGSYFISSKDQARDR